MQKLARPARLLDNAPLTRSRRAGIEYHKLSSSRLAATSSRAHATARAHRSSSERNGKPVKVPHARNSVRGLYCRQHILSSTPHSRLAYEAPSTARRRPGFANSEIAEGWHDYSRPRLPPNFSVLLAAQSPPSPCKGSATRSNAESSVLFAGLKLAWGGLVNGRLRPCPRQKIFRRLTQRSRRQGYRRKSRGSFPSLFFWAKSAPFAYETRRDVHHHPRQVVVVDFTREPGRLTCSSNLRRQARRSRTANKPPPSTTRRWPRLRRRGRRLVDHYHFARHQALSSNPHTSGASPAANWGVAALLARRRTYAAASGGLRPQSPTGARRARRASVHPLGLPPPV